LNTFLSVYCAALIIIAPPHFCGNIYSQILLGTNVSHSTASYSRITFKRPHNFARKPSEKFSQKLKVFPHQLLHYIYYLSRLILTTPPLWLHRQWSTRVRNVQPPSL